MAHIVVVGAGTIGSHVLPHVARMPDVTEVTVIDRDHYERSNLAAQNIYESDAGRSKAQLQARRLRQIDHTLRVRAIHAPVEDVPLGWLRADAILACLDSRRARMAVNQMAWRLGVPWINAGIDLSGLARVQVFVPSNEAACLECAWDARDYELVEQDYPCPGEPEQPESMASSELGALAASLQAIECRKLISDAADLLSGRDLMIDATHHRHYVTSFRRNADCRLPDHAGWAIERCDVDPAATTLGDVMELAAERLGRLKPAPTLASDVGAAFRRPEDVGAAFRRPEDIRIGVAGQQFTLMQECRQCRDRQPAGHVLRGARRSPDRCPRCKGDRVIAGFDRRDTVAFDELPLQARNRSLMELGILPRDVLTLTGADVELHLELNGSSWPIEF